MAAATDSAALSGVVNTYMLMHNDAATEHSTTEEDVETDCLTTEVTVQQQIYYETRAEEVARMQLGIAPLSVPRMSF